MWLAVAAGSFAAFVGVLVVDRLRKRRDEAQAYLKGVRSVISGDPDAAIEALSNAARLGTPEAVDTYLALGALFRRTGDLSRAVRLHRNMLLGPALDPSRRAEVERELAEDYRRSGMLAEAAEIYERLQADPVAAEGLRDVRAEQGDLAAAVEIQRRLGGGADDPVLAHLLAAHARKVGATDPARGAALAEEAIAARASSADALLALGEVEAARGDVARALSALGRALDADPRAVTLAWPALGRLGDRVAAEAFLRSRLDARPDDAGLHLLHARALYRLGRIPEALAAARRALDLDHSGEVTVAMRELLRDAETPPGPDDLAARHDILVAALLRRARPLRCARCGAETAARAWRCRRCGAFDPYP